MAFGKKILTVNLGVVGAAVEEDAHGIRPAVVDIVVVDLDVVATLGRDDAFIYF